MRKFPNLICIFIVVITCLLAYINSFSNEFVWDDNLLIKDNKYIEKSSYVKNIFKEDLYHMQEAPSGYYRPIQILSYIADYFLWSRNPAGYHLTNFLVHVVNALLVFYLCLLVLGERWKSCFIATVFSVHPAFVPIVSYVSGRADLLGFCFGVLSIYLVLRYILHGKNAVSLWLALLSYAIAILSKEYYIITPLFVALYLFAYKKDLKSRRGPLKAFFAGSVLIALLYAIFRVKFLNFSAVTEMALIHSFKLRAAIFPYVLTNYVITLFLPVNLSMEKMLSYSSLTEARFVFSYITPLVILGLLYYLHRSKERDKFFWLGWFLLGILPVSNLLIPLKSIWANHWTYMPSIGIFAIFTIWIGGLFRKVKVIAALLLVSLLAVVTFSENRYWQSEEALFAEIIRRNPSATTRLLYNTARAYYESGNYEKALEMYGVAIRRGVGKVDRCYFARAMVYHRMGDFTKAQEDFETAVKLNPYSPSYRNNLGCFYAERGMHDKAKLEWQKALELDPTFKPARRNLHASSR